MKRLLIAFLVTLLGGTPLLAQLRMDQIPAGGSVSGSDYFPDLQGNSGLNTPTGTVGLVTGLQLRTYILGGNTWTPGSGTLTLGSGKTFTASNTLTFAGTDGSTVNVGAGGTINALAYLTPGTGVATAAADATNSSGGFVTQAGGDSRYAQLAVSNVFTGATNTFVTVDASTLTVGGATLSWLTQDGGSVNPVHNLIALSTGSTDNVFGAWARGTNGIAVLGASSNGSIAVKAAQDVGGDVAPALLVVRHDPTGTAFSGDYLMRGWQDATATNNLFRVSGNGFFDVTAAGRVTASEFSFSNSGNAAVSFIGVGADGNETTNVASIFNSAVAPALNGGSGALNLTGFITDQTQFAGSSGSSGTVTVFSSGRLFTTYAYNLVNGGVPSTLILSLSDTQAQFGAVMAISVTTPASTNPTLTVEDANTSSVLDTFTSTTTAGNVLMFFSYNGTAWTPLKKGDLNVRTLGTGVQTALGVATNGIGGFPALDSSARVPTARLGSGTASSSTMLCGDQSYKTIPTGILADGSFSGTGSATTAFTVTIGSTLANNTYKVNVTPTASLSAAQFYISAKTTTTFTVTYLSGLTGTVTFDWVIAP